MRLLEINQPGATPLTAGALRADERVVNYIKGLNALDERLSALVAPNAAEVHGLAPSQLALSEAIVNSLEVSATEGRLPTIELLGGDCASKHDLAAHVCVALKRRIYRMGIGALPSQKAEMENLARLWQRETMMLPVSLYIDAEDMDVGNPETEASLQWFLSRDLGLVFVGAPRVGGTRRSKLHPIRGEQADREGTARRLALRLVRLISPRTARWLRESPGGAVQFESSRYPREHASIATIRSEPGDRRSTGLWDACRASDPPAARRAGPADRTQGDVGRPGASPTKRSRCCARSPAQVRGRYQVYRRLGLRRRR